MMDEGRRIFRFDTFGSESFWGDKLLLHQAIGGARNRGVGPGLSPARALAIGLKVDANAVPADVVQQIQSRNFNANDVNNTLALLRLNAVIGVTGFFNQDGSLRAIGIQCALCHSTVDNSFMAPGIAPGLIGNRLDGWPNRDLNVGAIINLAPNLRPFADLLGVDEFTVRQVVSAWGPGKFDAELTLDGIGFRPDGRSAATLLPPAFGLAGVNLHTWTGWGSITHWNAFVSNLEMHGVGRFFDPRLNDANQFPVAARNKLGDIPADPDKDQITSKLAALHFYQLGIPAPTPPQGSFNAEAAARGRTLFSSKARCFRCHVPPLFTEPGWNMHTAEEIGIDSFQANRSPDRRYRTAPLKGLWAHQRGGFYHDGRFANLTEVVNHYNSFMQLGLSERERQDLIQYLLSL